MLGSKNLLGGEGTSQTSSNVVSNQFHHQEVELEELEVQEVEGFPHCHHCHLYQDWQDWSDQPVTTDLLLLYAWSSSGRCCSHCTFLSEASLPMILKSI